ncbi:autotransporter-associated beta strand repeat-containing protein [Mesorhizobium sp. BR1-1-2]|uniref:autotransporter-associated beta strand repeat-containing protein n=1 Tax=Mesorhizobium sp. BR1-1-2 TaxID=2876652 RepID=UPI001CCDC3E4|nr:autotransporter-associated beta strand repeat-containing protein [Mesorhizobium sp. BR1-1-2]MBZ9966932.1 autotransporter-associated beta strand repeat-containing protein [Mesorhizobium sp. BR1-1-2]
MGSRTVSTSDRGAASSRGVVWNRATSSGRLLRASLLVSTALTATAYSAPARAQDATWLASPADGNYNNDANWSSGAAPTTTATFGASSVTSLSFSSNTTIDGWTFNAGGPDYDFINGSALAFNGAGIVANGGRVAITNNGGLYFYSNSSAGSAAITNSGYLAFYDNSTAGGATITNTSTLDFNNASTAGSAVITNNGNLYFYNNSTAGSAAITNNGNLYFYDASTAGNAAITNDNYLSFNNTSTAGNAAITNASYGYLYFFDNSTAGDATITNTSSLSFRGTSTAGGATITNNAGLSFFENSRAGGAAITNNAGLYFYDTSTASNAAITNNYELTFWDASTAGDAAVTNNSGGTVDFSYSTGPNGDHKLSAGSIAGPGSYVLGANRLTVGSNGLSTEVSGVISGAGGSLAKIGTGTLTLSGTNSYSGGTTISGGILQLGNGGATGAIIGALTLGSGGRFDVVNADTSGITSLTNAGGIVNVGDDNLLAGSISNTGAGRINLGARAALYDTGSVLNNDATINVGTDGIVRSNGDINNNAGGVITFEGPGGTAQLSPAGSVYNSGQINVIGGDVWMGLSYFNNQSGGSVSLTGGDMSWVNSFTNAAGATLNIAAGHKLSVQFLNFYGGTATGAGTIEAAGGIYLWGPGAIGTTLAGTASLSKGGPDTTVLTGAHSYTGGTTINAGTLQLGDSSMAGAILGAVNVAGYSGTFDVVNANTSGITSITNTGTTNFRNGTSAGSATIANEGYLSFYDNSTGGSAAITNNQYLYFWNASTAGSAAITNNGNLSFHGSSTAGNATIANSGSMVFSDSSTAGNATITNNDGLSFYGSSTAGGATITSNAVLSFVDNGTAGGAAITNNGGLYFYGTSTAGNAAITNVLVGTVDFSGSLGPNGDGKLSAGSIAGAGDYNLGGNELTVGSNGFSTEVSGVISGAGGALVKTGGGTLTLSGVNSYSGGTTILDGVLQLGNGGGAGSIFGDVVNNGVLAFNRSNAVIFYGDISGSGAVRQIGHGTTILTRSNTYSAGTTILGGTLQIGDGGATGSITGDVTNNSTLAFNRSDVVTFSGVISGSGAVRQIGAGMTILTSENTFSGGTTIAGGTLQLGNAGGAGSIIGNVINDGVLAFNRTGTLTLAGDISGSGAAQQIGLGTTILTGTNSYSGDTLVTDGRLQFGDGSAGRSNTLGGNLIVAGGTLAIQTPATVSVAQTVTFGANTALSITAGANSPVLSANSVTIGNNVALNISGIGDASQLDKVLIDTTSGISGDFASVSVGGFGGTVDYLTVSTRKSTDSLQYIASYGLSWNAGNDLAHGSFTLANPTDSFTVGATLSDQAANPVTGWNGTALTKAGPGTLILTGDNTYTGGTTISGGTLQLGNGGATGSILGHVVNDGVLAFNRGDVASFGGVISGSGAVRQISGGTTILTGDNTYSGGTTIARGTLQIGNGGVTGSILGNVVNNGVLAFNRSDAVTFAGDISGTGAVQQIGSGTTILAGSNTYAGGTTISGRTLQLGDGGVIGSITGNVSNDGVLALNRSDVVTFGGDISGSGAVQQIGQGTTILTGANSYSGGTTISGGTLQIGEGGATGSITGHVANNGTLAFNRSDAFTFAGAMSGNGALNQIGSGTTTLTGAGSSVGMVTIGNGTLALGQTGTFSAASYTTQSGAVTAIGGAAQLAVTGAFTQDTGSTLNVTLGANEPTITADSASLSGTLKIAGLTAPSSASALAGTQFTVLATTNGISGDFANITIGGSSNPVDYLRVTGGRSVDNLDYNIGLGLIWTVGAAQGNGTFTLTNSTDAFNVDVALTNQTGPFASGWDGKSLTKAGGGALTLSAMSTYTGTTTINGGTLAITATGGITSDVINNATFRNAGTVAGSVTNNAGAIFTQTGGGVSSDVINYGTVNANGGALNGAIANNAGGIFTVGGTLTGDSTFNNANGATLTVSATGDYTLAGLLTNSGAVTVAAGGSLTAPGGILNRAGGVITNNGTLTDALDNAGLVTNNGTYNATVASNSGTINNTAGGIWSGNFNTSGIVNNEGTINGSLIQTAGTTANNGTITGAAAVSGGLFTGSGSVGGLTIASGATVAPGVAGGIGTMSAAGNVTFDAGSIYQVTVNTAGQASRINATGSIAINGGSVNVLAGSGHYAPSTTYIILSTTTNGGRTGTFDSVSSNLAFLTPTLGYDASDVTLTMTRNAIDFAAIGITANQIATGGGVESLGFGNRVYSAVLNLSAPQAQYAFNQLSGEIHSSTKTALIEDSRFVRSAINDRIRAAFDAVGASGTVSTYEGGKPVTVKANTDRFAVWGQAFGSWGHTSSDGNAARLGRKTGGFFIGADAPVFDTWRFGAVAGYSQTSFDVKDRRSSGSSDNYYVGLYGGTAWGDLAFRTGAAYTWHDVSTNRSVAFPGFDGSLKGGYNTATAQMFGELAYGFSAGSARVEPFTNLAYVNFHTDGFTEQGGAAALTGASANTDATFATFGLRASTTFDIGGTALNAKGMVGWRHAFGDMAPTSTVRFVGGGSNAFAVGGAPIARDAAVIEAGLDYAITSSATLGVSYGGQFGSGMSDQSARFNFNVKF